MQGTEIPTIVADDVAAAQVAVLEAIAENEGQEVAQQTFNEALAGLTANANERLATEIEARTAAEAQLAEANNNIANMSARIAELEQQAADQQATHEQFVEARNEEIAELNEQVTDLNTQVSDLQAANEKLSAETKPKPADVNDLVEDEDVAPTTNLSGLQLYGKLKKKHTQASAN